MFLNSSVNFIRRVVFVALLAVIFSIIPTCADAATVMIDTRKIMEEADVMKYIRNQVDAKLKEFQKEGVKDEKAFSDKYKDLESRKSLLSEEAYNKEYENLIKATRESEKKAYDRKLILDNAFMKANMKVEEALLEILEKESKANKWDTVLHKGVILYSSMEDITDAVLKSLNKKMKKVNVVFESPKK